MATLGKKVEYTFKIRLCKISVSSAEILMSNRCFNPILPGLLKPATILEKTVERFIKINVQNLVHFLKHPVYGRIVHVTTAQQRVACSIFTDILRTRTKVTNLARKWTIL